MAAADAVITLPPPGSSSEVARLVTASTALSHVPQHLTPSIMAIASDSAVNTAFHTPVNGCPTFEPQCTFGVKNSKKIVVLFGDSHAWMWLPAVEPAVARAGYRLQLIWMPACPAADLTVWFVRVRKPYPECTGWRRTLISMIKKERPRLVLVSERTAQLHATATRLVTDMQFIAGLETTIADLRTPSTRVALIGDLPVYANRASPAACLSVHLTTLQSCSIPVHSPVAEWATHVGAEHRVALDMHAPLIDPQPWVCGSSRCSPVVGNMATYMDWCHITATYSAYLSGVMGAKLVPLLR
jgi:hypothetical protein